ncbi:hypothetical protein INT44_004483 [Umbelopsis vinacea]|uniref:WWE domain-containing protein n=1 Tax=Umbelopsis vinacea TaxID=44442 RepID=A0A8H7QBH3_9FUNG|nr:hypothetical protein INT44_004483 [Umbelopsis vinacea]KAI9276477.1 hypothetical protein BC943DRAFT_190387 [Umbelopsis sp. AD052]
MQPSAAASAGDQASHSPMALYSAPYRTSRPRLESPQQPHQTAFQYNRPSHYHRYSSPSPPHLPSNNRGNVLPFSSSTQSSPNNALPLKAANGSTSATSVVHTPPTAPVNPIAESKEKQQAIVAPSQPQTTSASASNENQQDTAQAQEITWLFFRDNKWMPFQSENHYKIEQAFTLGGIYVDIKDHNFPQLKSIRVFPTRFYLSYLGMKYRLSCVIQG